MIQLNSKLKVADNTGAKELQVIQVQGRQKGGGYQRYGRIGDIVSASVKTAISTSQLKEGEVVYAVVVRTKKEMRRNDGTYIKFDDNAAVVINKQTLAPIGTRIFGPVAREIRDKGFQRIVSLAPETL